jgi:hypothetical protein
MGMPSTDSANSGCIAQQGSNHNFSTCLNAILSRLSSLLQVDILQWLLVLLQTHKILLLLFYQEAANLGCYKACTLMSSTACIGYQMARSVHSKAAADVLSLCRP